MSLYQLQHDAQFYYNKAKYMRGIEEYFNYILKKVETSISCCAEKGLTVFKDSFIYTVKPEYGFYNPKTIEKLFWDNFFKILRANHFALDYKIEPITKENEDLDGIPKKDKDEAQYKIMFEIMWGNPAEWERAG